MKRFALDNGSVGVYHKKTRLWRVKSKVKAISLVYIDQEKDGFSGLLIGWENGRLEVILENIIFYFFFKRLEVMFLGNHYLN